MKILPFLHTFFDVLRFGGTLEKFDGTPVENHCSRETPILRKCSTDKYFIRTKCLFGKPSKAL